MLKSFESFDSIYVACSPTDLRKNVDGLSILIKKSFQIDPFSNSIFLFCNGARNRLKALVWDKNSFVMILNKIV
ncbi:MAG: IS66 family insertion sequence element accessory protein TnpB [Bacillota bacterium]